MTQLDRVFEARLRWLELDRVFEARLRRLEDWHADDVKAQNYAGASGGGHQKPGSRELRRREFPGAGAYRRRWREAGAATFAGVATRVLILQELDAEIKALAKRPPVVTYTDWWGKQRYELATATGSKREVAARFEVSESTVARARREHRRQP